MGRTLPLTNGSFKVVWCSYRERPVSGSLKAGCIGRSSAMTGHWRHRHHLTISVLRAHLTAKRRAPSSAETR